MRTTPSGSPLVVGVSPTLSAGADAADAAPSPWETYWAALRPHSVIADEAAFYVTRLRRVVELARYRRVLDFGCGFGFAATLLAPHVAALCLWDRSPAMRRHAAARLAHLGNVVVPSVLPRDAAFDLVLVNSVVQYMSAAERRAWLRVWRTLLAPGGVAVLSDVPSVAGARARLAELVDVLAFYARRGRLATLVRERARDLAAYLRSARAQPLVAMAPGELATEAAATGFDVAMLSESLTCRSRRFAAILRAGGTPEHRGASAGNDASDIGSGSRRFFVCSEVPLV